MLDDENMTGAIKKENKKESPFRNSYSSAVVDPQHSRLIYVIPPENDLSMQALLFPNVFTWRNTGNYVIINIKYLETHVRFIPLIGKHIGCNHILGRWNACEI